MGRRNKALFDIKKLSSWLILSHPSSTMVSNFGEEDDFRRVYLTSFGDTSPNLCAYVILAFFTISSLWCYQFLFSFFIFFSTYYKLCSNTIYMYNVILKIWSSIYKGIMEAVLVSYRGLRKKGEGKNKKKIK